MPARARWAVAASAVVFAVLLALRAAGSFERMELAAYDAGLQIRAPAVTDPRVVVIDETEDDLKRFGHPLSDAVLARIIERALAGGAVVVGVDKFRDIPVPPGTEALDALLKSAPNVYWGYQFGGTGARRIAPPRALAGTRRIGFVDVVVDPGGIVRRGLLYLDEGGPAEPSLPLALALAWLRGRGIAPRPDPANPARLQLGAASIAPLEADDGGYAGVDAAGYQVLLDFRGAAEAFQRVGVRELLEGRADSALLRGRIAIVGSSAESLRDFFHTPLTARSGAPVSGADIQAHLASQLVRLGLGEARPVRTLPERLEIGLLALCCLLGAGAWFAVRGGTMAAYASAGFLVLVLAWLGLARAGVWLPVVQLAIGFGVAWAVCAALRALQEARERAELMTLFSRHVAPEVARELWERRTELTDGSDLRPRRLHVTVLFADLHGYTPVAETMSAEDTARWLNDFMRPMAVIIMGHRGVIRQYAGDAVMAVFGAPLPSETLEDQERDARVAVACALEMRRKLEDVNAAWRQAGRPTAGMRIGIHSGPVVGCNIGSRQRREYALVGDTVNVAARLQALALPGGDEGESGRILIGEPTRALLPADAPCEPLGEFHLKGRRQPLTVYRAH